MFGLNLSWRRASLVFLIDVGVLALAGRWPGDPEYADYAWWSGVGVATAITIVALVTYRGVPLARLPATAIRDLFTSPTWALDRGRTDPVDHHRRYGRESVGMREYQGRLVSVIAVSAREEPAAGRHRRGATSTAGLPVEVVAAGLSQFDVQLDGIDIVSVGRSRVIKGVKGDDKADADGDGADGAGQPAKQTASKRRRTWLVLRMNTQHNMPAVAARDSVAATLAAATERLVHDLDGRHVTAEAMTAEQFDTVDAALLAGLDPEDIRVRRGRLKLIDSTERVTSFWLSPADITSENLEELWNAHTDATVVTVRITRKHSRPEVAVVVRYHSDGRLDKADIAGLNRLTNRQLAAVRVGLPVPQPDRGPAIPGRTLRDDEQLAVPVDPAVPQRVRVGARS